MALFTATRSIIESAIRDRVFPGAAIQVGTPEDVVWQEAFGRLTYAADAAPVSAGTVYDLSSLTKVIATTTLAMRLVDRGRLNCVDRLATRLPEWDSPDRQTATIRQLLAHCAGLSPWLPLFRACTGRREFQPAICRVPLDYAPGTRAVYSDLGFILLGFIIEDAGEAPLDTQFSALFETISAIRPPDEPASPADRAHPSRFHIGFSPPSAWASRIAPTEIDAWRGRLLVGEVHDENCSALGGVAGHAGLFGTAGAVGLFARALLRARLGADDSLARPDTVVAFTTRQEDPGSSRALGWDTMLPTSSCGTRMSPVAFGHTGFTGTSLWIDPIAERYVVLLTNRVHPSRASDRIQGVRRGVHDSVMEEVGAA